MTRRTNANELRRKNVWISGLLALVLGALGCGSAPEARDGDRSDGGAQDSGTAICEPGTFGVSRFDESCFM